MNLKSVSLSPLQRMVLAAIVLLGFALRIHDLGAQSLWYDEGSTLTFARHMNSINDAFDTTFTSDPPIFPLLVKGWATLVRAAVPSALSPWSDFGLRLLPFAFAMGTLLLVFSVTRQLTRSADAALFAAFLYAISPYQIRYAQELRNYSLLTLLGMATLYFYINALRNNRKRDWAAVALLEVLLLYTHFFSAWLILAINFYYVLHIVLSRDLRTPRIAPWLAFQAAALLLSLPALLMVGRMAEIINNIKHHWYPMISPKIALITFKSFFAGFSPNAAAYWPLFALTLCLFLFALYAWRREWHVPLLLATLVGVPLAANIVMAKINGFSLFELRLFIVSGVAASMAVGAGISKLPRRWMRLGAAALIGALTVPLAADYYDGRLHPMQMHRVAIWAKPDLRSAAAYIAANSQPGDVLGHAVHGTTQPMYHYCSLPQVMLGHSEADRQFLVDNFGTEHHARNHNQWHEPIQQVAARAQRIWFLQTNGMTFDWPPQVMMIRTWLETFAIREHYQVFDGVSVTCYRRDAKKRSNALRDVLADYGDAPLVRYRFADGAQDAQAAADYAQYMKLPCDTFGIQFDLQPDQAGALVASAPQFAHQQFTYRFSIVNRSDVARAFACTVLDSVGAVEPLAWVRDDPMTALWRPVPQYDNETNGAFNRPSMAAHFHGAAQGPAVMQGSTLLPAGRYAPYARVLEEPAAAVTSRAAASFAIEATGDTLGTLDSVSAAQPGWHWRRLNTLDTQGGPLNIIATATNPRRLENAFFQLERVLFVPETADGPVAHQFDLTLGPRETKSFELKGALDGLPRKRIDIEVLDLASRTYRGLVFHVERSQTDGSH